MRCSVTMSIVAAAVLGMGLCGALAAPATQSSDSGGDYLQQAIAEIQASHLDRAKQILEQNMRGEDVSKLPRLAILNLAVIDVDQKVNVMRSIKNLVAYLPSAEADEDGVNLLGAALAIAEKNHSFSSTKLYADGKEAFWKANQKLDATRPGKFHWGAKWIDRKEHARIEHDRAHAKRAVDSAQESVTRRQKALDDARAELKKLTGASIKTQTAEQKRKEEQKVDEAKAKVQAAQERLDDAQQKLDEANKQMPHPDWPTHFDAVTQ